MEEFVDVQIDEEEEIVKDEQKKSFTKIIWLDRKLLS